MNMIIQSGSVSPPVAGPVLQRGAPAAGTTGAQGSASPQPAPQAVAQPQPPLTNEGIKQVARQIDDFLKASSSNLEVSVDNESDEVIVRVVDTETQEVIRQIPSKEMLAISQAIDHMSGLLLRQTA
ncbi:MAG: flagellar protein FlaG [Betaproteobacteria bacterium]|nr:flagellar protein FlaG [Betaproteobacteria bacterium]